MDEPEIDTDRIDEAVLALMYLTLHDIDELDGFARAWKGFEWETLARLHAKDFIENPVGRTKSVMLTPEGVRRSRALFQQLFGRDKVSS